MITTEHRAGFVAQLLTPTAQVFMRRLHPGWSWVATSAGNVLELPDVVGGVVTKGAGGTLTASYGGWVHPIAGDTATSTDGSKIYRVACHRAYNVANSAFYLYRIVDPENLAQWTTAAFSVTPSGTEQAYKTRGGVFATGASAGSYYYVRASGEISKRNFDDTGWLTTTTYASTNRYATTAGAAVAPVEEGGFFVYHLKANSRNLYLDFYRNGAYVFTDRILGQCPDAVPHWVSMHWFDAEPLYDHWCVVANHSLLGTSRGYLVQGAIVSEPISLLPFDDLDWTGLMKVASLSTINGRLYAVAWQKFQASDQYSQALTTCLWSSDGLHWAQPQYLAITTENIAGKLVVIGEKVALVGSANVLLGERTLDFGGTSFSVQMNVTPALTQLSFERNISTGSSCEVTLKVPQMSAFATENLWLPMSHQVDVRLSADRTNFVQVGTWWLDGPHRTNSVTTAGVGLQGRGSYARLLDNTQFTDEILDNGIQKRAELSVNELINRAGSVWSSSKGVLWTEFPNESNESIAVGGSPVSRDGWELISNMTYEAQATAFGLIVWMGSEDRDPTDEASDHNFVYVLCTNKRNNTVDISLRRRTGSYTNGVWAETDSELVAPVNVAWSAGDYHRLKAQFQSGTLYVWYVSGGVWTQKIAWVPGFVLSPRTLLGIYAKGTEARLTDSALEDEETLSVDDASYWPSTGTLVANGSNYTFTRTGNDLAVTPPLVAFLSKGDVLTLKDSRVGCDWVSICNASMRWSVADICKRLAKRSGVYMQVDSQGTDLTTWQTIEAPYPVYERGYWVFSSGGALLVPVKVSSFVAELYFSELSVDNEYVEIAAYGAQARLIRIGGVLHTRALSGGTAVGTSPTTATATSGWLRVVFSEGWIHFYLNRMYLGSHWHKSFMPKRAHITIRGYNVTVHSLRLDVGCEVAIPGVWDSQSPAREVIERITKGRDIVITENANGTLRLQSALAHDNLGPLDMDRVIEFGYGRTWKDSGSALVIEGGYEWGIGIDEKMLLAQGLLWQRVENHSLLNTGELTAYIASALRRSRAGARSYSFSGRYDPAMLPNDSFVSPSYGGHGQREYVVNSMSVEYIAESARLALSNLEAIGKEEVVDSGVFGTDAYNSVEWT